VVYLFRIFFALCLIGSLKSFVEQLQRHPITGENIGAILLTTVILIGCGGNDDCFLRLVCKPV
jgi:hypothetical protein